MLCCACAQRGGEGALRAARGTKGGLKVTKATQTVVMAGAAKTGPCCFMGGRPRRQPDYLTRSLGGWAGLGHMSWERKKDGPLTKTCCAARRAGVAAPGRPTAKGAGGRGWSRAPVPPLYSSWPVPQSLLMPKMRTLCMLASLAISSTTCGRRGQGAGGGTLNNSGIPLALDDCGDAASASGSQATGAGDRIECTFV